MRIYEILLAAYVEEFHNPETNGEEMIKAICNCGIPSTVVLSQYHRFEPIEKMPEREKEELKKYVLESFPEKTTEEKVIAAKVIYTFGNLI